MPNDFDPLTTKKDPDKKSVEYKHNIATEKVQIDFVAPVDRSTFYIAFKRYSGKYKWNTVVQLRKIEISESLDSNLGLEVHGR